MFKVTLVLITEIRKLDVTGNHYSNINHVCAMFKVTLVLITEIRKLDVTTKNFHY